MKVHNITTQAFFERNEHGSGSRVFSHTEIRCSCGYSGIVFGRDEEEEQLRIHNHQIEAIAEELGMEFNLTELDANI